MRLPAPNVARPRADGLRLALLGAVVSFLVVAPLTRRGWLLLLDWAPGPRSIGPTGAAALPTGPMFLWPAQVAHAGFGAASGWLPIAVALGIAGAGAARLVGGPWPARVTAAVAFAWNPFVFDRIAAGQVSVLAGYALLPWLAAAALHASSRRDALTVGIWWAAAALCTLHFAWIGGVLVAAVGAVRWRTVPARRLGAAVGIAIAVPLVLVGGWVLAAHASAPAGDPAVLTTFGTTDNSGLGRGFGILAQQGFWREVVRSPSADLGGAFPFIACAVIAVAAAGLLAARHTARARLAAAVALAGAAGWLLAHGGAGPFGALYRAGFEHVPGFAIMREAQKWVALVSLATAVGLGSFATAITRSRARVAAWLVVLVPIALAPTMAWGLAARIAPSRYPTSWESMRTTIDELPSPVIALPFEHYVLPGITGNRTVADIGPAYFGSRVVASDDAKVPGLAGDIDRRAAIAAAIQTARADADRGRPLHLGTDLGRLGISGLLVLARAPGVALERDPGLEHRATAAYLDLWVVR